jgi:uncharacterized protein YtpQ (UPF0354 family)
VINRFVTAALETAKPAEDRVDRNLIVPIIKDRPWLEETRNALASRGFKNVPETVYEDFAPGLIIVYAVDSSNTMRYLTPKDIEDAKLERKELRTLACQNLKRVLPNIERRGANGVFMLTAGGNYEASLLLLSSLWSGGRMPVKGNVVVAIPHRDVLFVTGSNDKQGIAKVKEAAAKSYGQGAYKLTPKLFVFRDGKFEEFVSPD